MTILLSIVVDIPCDDDDDVCRYIEDAVTRHRQELREWLRRAVMAFILDKLVEEGVISSDAAHRLYRKYLAEYRKRRPRRR